ncbi:LysR family transcriptional regulator [Trabulsiella odontotermitis]|uniref:LysR family transcriptional regulator n=1 Tax=Trabulsiella odontotermitis TaxID=379893 RepID=UPI0024B86F55|nr:LysR family transcriptional regulator [Trabulsiella odontotermitis]WHP33090.1 LysR family transcriptional regulator [Trabulsiella odontotermitis]
MISRTHFLALNTFVMVAEKLNFRAVADQLGVSASAVSQQINGLEEDLGLRLFNRTTRSVSLTEDGRALYLQTAPLLENLSGAIRQAQSRSQIIQGSIRIHAFRSAADMLLDSKIPFFLAAFPDVHIDVAIHDSPVDLIAGGYDLSLRLGEVLAPGLVAVPVGGPLHQIVVAAPSYLAAHDRIRQPEDLIHHNCIGWRWPGTVTPEPWQFAYDGQLKTMPVSGNLVVDDRERQYQAAIAGVGVAQVTEERVRAHLASGALHRILETWETEFAGYYLCWTAGRSMSPAMRAFIDALRRA